MKAREKTRSSLSFHRGAKPIRMRQRSLRFETAAGMNVRTFSPLFPINGRKLMQPRL